jgi:hypothetical protein
MRNILYFLILSFLFSCSANKFSIGSGVNNDPFCPAPCWNGLIPGKTNVEELNKNINNISVNGWILTKEDDSIPNCNILEYSNLPYTGKSIIGNPLLFADNGAFDIEIYNDIILLIRTYNFSHIKENYPSLGKILEIWGSPEYYSAVHFIGPDGEVYDLSLFYPHLGLEFSVDVSEIASGNVSHETRFYNITYSIPGNLEMYLINDNLCHFGREKSKTISTNIINIEIQPWLGLEQFRFIEIGGPG